MGVKLNLVVVRVNDLEASRRFYNSIGLVLTSERHGNGPQHYSADLDGVVVEFYPRSSDGDRTDQPRLGFSVPNINEVLAACQNAGGEIISAPKDSPWGRRAVVQDPDGHKVELIEK
jgi:catechol 2,3-dioxygenase-like lactoylglutathione lyase family enzyme